MSIELYCDGSSSGKSNQPTGWAWIAINVETQEILFSGSKASVVGTNNTAELFAVVDGLLEYVNRRYTDSLVIVSDSMYALGISSGEYTPTKNLEEAAAAKAIYGLVGAKYRWVRGHNGDLWNEKVDEMAGEARMSMLPPGNRKTKKTRKSKEKT